MGVDNQTNIVETGDGAGVVTPASSSADLDNKGTEPVFGL